MMENETTWNWLLGLSIGGLVLLPVVIGLDAATGHDAQMGLFLGGFVLGGLGMAAAAFLGSLIMLLVPGAFARSRAKFFATLVFSCIAIATYVIAISHA